MDIGRDILTNTLLGSKDWEKVFSPWWITVHHYLVYSLVVLGLIALPINCMISVQGNCSYHPAHPRNYVLPMKICRMNEELSQIVIEKRYCTTKQRNVLNETFGIIATQEDSVFEYQTIRNIAFMSEMWKAAKAKEHTTNFNNCLLKMNPRAFPFHLYYACVNQLDALALYFPYLVLTLALFLVILERLCTRYLWTGRRIEKFYELLVKDIIEEGGSKAMNSLEQRQKCQQIIYDFMNSSFLCGSYIVQTTIKVLVCLSVLIWSIMGMCHSLRESFKTDFNCEVRDCKMGSHSSEVSGKRKDATISWNEPHAASFIGENVPTEHLMYVLEINPPIDWHKQGDNVTMVPACADDGECIFNPLVVSTDWDGKTTSSLASALTTLERESEEVKQIPKPIGSPPSRLDKSSSKDSVFSGYSVNNNATEAIVSGTHANGRNLLATHLYKSSMARNQTEQRTTASRSFKHAFVGLRMDTDYKITLKFVLSGRALGSEAFTILSHDGESRKTSAVSNSDSNLNSSLASRTTRNQWIQANNDTELTAMLEDCAAQSDRVILDFEAKWCPNCRNLQEALKELPSRCQVKHSVFIQADVDECPKVSASFQFSTLPALFVLKEGQIDHCMMGKGALEHGPEIITKLCALDE
ncbi:uncharacterized protein LOC131885667 isoform X3 [Tigriopus californicus]|uniref:uncharacterized protein LOC131885667 isoform X3 n=1 Tax=Tigriopus californicus TaxID=6832 RepID=UPI0027DA52B2|nr:uncharacterized protein LOC131885667 isoform X3 [Tigriopus californicus]